MFKKFDSKKRKFYRVNYQIKSPTVRVIKDDTQIGILAIEKARKVAQDAGLDLVEVVPDAKPPVCKIVNFDKFRYQQKQKEKDSQKKQKTNEIKQIRFRPAIQQHDMETKVAAIKKFIEQGKRVLINMQFKRSELRHKDQGFAVVNEIIKLLESVASVEIPPRFEGSRLTCRLSPHGEKDELQKH